MTNLLTHPRHEGCLSIDAGSSNRQTVAAVETDVLDGHFRLALLPVVGVVIKLRSSVLAEPVRAHATQPRALQSFVMEQLHRRL